MIFQVEIVFKEKYSQRQIAQKFQNTVWPNILWTDESNLNISIERVEWMSEESPEKDVMVNVRFQ